MFFLVSQTYIRRQRVAQEWAAQIAGASPAPTRPPGRGKLEHRARRADLAAVLKPRLGQPVTTDAAHLRVVRSYLAKATPQAPTPRKPLWERGARPTVAIIGDAEMRSSIAGGPPSAQNILIAAILQCVYIVVRWTNETYSSSVRPPPLSCHSTCSVRDRSLTCVCTACGGGVRYARRGTWAAKDCVFCHDIMIPLPGMERVWHVRVCPTCGIIFNRDLHSCT